MRGRHKQQVDYGSLLYQYKQRVVAEGRERDPGNWQWEKDESEGWTVVDIHCKLKKKKMKIRSLETKKPRND